MPVHTSQTAVRLEPAASESLLHLLTVPRTWELQTSEEWALLAPVHMVHASRMTIQLDSAEGIAPLLLTAPKKLGLSTTTGWVARALIHTDPTMGPHLRP